jgi:acyl-CoA synthetase (NDP forming)
MFRFIAEGGFTGTVYPVNPSRSEILGHRCYPSLSDLPEVPDLTIIAVSANQCTNTLRELGRLGGQAAICMAAGFREESEAGAALEREVTAAARDVDVALLGPNSVGFRNSSKNLYAVFATDVTLGVLPGSIAVISQSGGLAGYLGAALTKSRGTGYRWIIDAGNEVDVDIADCIAYVSQDEGVSAIGLILEGSQDGPRLRAALETAREAGKPVIAFKIGRSAAGARAAMSHSGALAGSDEVWNAVFRQHGVYRARDEHEFIETLGMYDVGAVPQGNRVAVFSLSGGLATLLVDACDERGLQVPTIPPPPGPAIRAALPSARFDNPLDLSGQIGAEPHVLQQVLEHVLSQPNIDCAVLGFAYMLQAKHISDVFVPAIAAAGRRHPKPMVLAGLANAEAEAALRKNGVLVEPMPVDAINVLAALTHAEAPAASVQVRSAATTRSTAQLVQTGSRAAEQLNGVPFVSSHPAETVRDALRLADEVGWPVALKVDGGDTTHKTELGLVVTDIDTPEELRDALTTLLARRAEIGTGDVVVEPMLSGVEMALGVYDDPTFGPVVMVGLGGIFVEVLGDVSFGVVPVDRGQAGQMLQRLRGYPLLTGARGRKPACQDDLVDTIVALSEFADAHRGWLAEIDINPFIVAPKRGESAAVDAVLVWNDDTPGSLS